MPPDGEGFNDWRVATTLLPVDVSPFGFGGYCARDYADLIDHPVEMGRFTRVGFEVAGVPHSMVITGSHDADQARLAHDLARLCAEHRRLFGELPVDRYLFLVSLAGAGYGGLEHSHSAALLCPRADLPYEGLGAPSEGYQRLLGLCSHEYFHLWNVKRIRPLALIGASLSQEVYTRTLWAFEGITRYYEDLALVRSGCIDETAYLTLLAQTISRVMRNPGRRVQTLAESSFDAWTKFYKQDENAPNALVSYYEKGALVALALDLMLRRRTNARRSLDDVMRTLWERHGRTGQGVPERGVEAVAEEVAGCPLEDFFDLALNTTRDLELNAYLADMGLAMRLRPARGPADLGGAVETFDDQVPSPALGLRLQSQDQEAVVGNVLSGSAAEEAGLAPGDALVALDGLRVSSTNLGSLVARRPVGAMVEVHAFRRDELMALSLRLKAAPADTCEIRRLPDATQDARERRCHWLGRTA